NTREPPAHVISTAPEIVMTNLALPGRVVFALRSEGVLAKQQPFYRHRRRAVLRVTLRHDRVERQRQILEMRAVVRPGIDANDIAFPHARSPRIISKSLHCPT